LRLKLERHSKCTIEVKLRNVKMLTQADSGKDLSQLLAYTLVKECTHDHEAFRGIVLAKAAAGDKEKRASETVSF
jgi:hypothetical protein